MSFGMGDAMVTGASLGLAAPDDKTVLHFRGPQIMAASIKKLASLGLSKVSRHDLAGVWVAFFRESFSGIVRVQATKVLLTGTAGAGQQVFLQADLFHAAVKAVAPGLTVFKGKCRDLSMRLDVILTRVDAKFLRPQPCPSMACARTYTR